MPTLVVGAMADQDIFLADVRAEYELSGATDKRLEFIEGADHFFEGRLRELREAIETWMKQALSSQ